MEEIFSHPDDGERSAIALQDHLEDVADRAGEIVPANRQTPYESPLEFVVERLAWIHDLGKATTWFQQYIGMLEGDPESNPTHHAPLGALAAYYVLECTGHESEECLVGYVAVACHHRQLPSVPEYVFERTDWVPGKPAENKSQRELCEQVANIDEGASDYASKVIETATDGAGSWAEFVEFVQDRELFERVKSQVSSSGFHHDTDALSSSFYPATLQTWSALVYADKTSAANVPRAGYEADQPSRAVLESYIDEIEDGAATSGREGTLNQYRARARSDALESVDALVESEQELATVTLPTGFGKTLTGLEAACKLRDQTDRERIIYALPFTSIIDQVVDEVQSIFNTDARDRLLTVHHHLAETVTELDEQRRATDMGANVETMIGESWRSGLVVTTFVQLLESLVAPANTQSMKLPALYDSVVILDEPQSIPHDWWTLVEYLGNLLQSEYNASVIAMTATQPKLFDDSAVKLVSTPETYVQEIERVVYSFDSSVPSYQDETTTPVEYDTAADRLVADVKSDESVLAVCNTIDSAQQLTTTVTDRIDAVDIGNVYAELLGSTPESVDESQLVSTVEERADGPVVAHLSTRLRPVDRLQIIEAIKRLTEQGLPVLTVSTQLIEAGVDISFGRVYRDLAPIDSIVQAAGRCNRSFEQKHGDVHVWLLESPEDKEYTPAAAVYDRWGESLLSLTVDVLDDVGALGTDSHVEEAVVAWESVQTYYDRLENDRQVGTQEYVDWLDSGDCEKAGKLSLIDQRRAVDVIVCRTAAERDRVESIESAWSDRRYDDMKAVLSETKPLQVSIPIYNQDSSEAETLGQLPRVHPESDIRWMDAMGGDYTEYFDETTGFVVPDSTVERRFL